MAYVWSPNAALGIADSGLKRMHCQGYFGTYQTRGMLCIDTPDDENLRDAKRILTAMAQHTPDKVKDKDLVALAELCLCEAHIGLEEVVADEMRYRLGEAVKSYRSFQKVHGKLKSLRQDLAYQLDLQITSEFDNSVINVIEGLYEDLHCAETEIASLEETLKKEEENVEQTTAQIIEHEQEAAKSHTRIRALEKRHRNFRSRAERLAADLLESQTKCGELNKDLQSADARIQDLESDLVSSQSDAEKTRTELQDRQAEYLELAKALQKSNRNTHEQEDNLSDAKAQNQEFQTTISQLRLGEEQQEQRLKDGAGVIKQLKMDLASFKTSAGENAQLIDTLRSSTESLQGHFRDSKAIEISLQTSVGELLQTLRTTQIELQACNNHRVAGPLP